MEGGTGSVGSGITQEFILGAYTKCNEEKKKTQCIPFGSCEGATGKDNNIRGGERERERGKRLSIIRDTGEAH